MRRQFNVEAVVRGTCFERLAAAVKVWFFEVGAVVLGAEGIAIAAMVAVVGKVGDLVSLLKFEKLLVADGNHTTIGMHLDVTIG